MATVEELSAALVKADAAGNAADAKAFADAIRQMRGGIPGPRKTNTAADLIPGNNYPMPASTAAPQPKPASFTEKLLAPVETAVALTTGAVTGPIVAGSEVLGALASGKFGTKEGVREGEATGRKVQQFFQPALSPTAQGYTEAIGNALASTGLQGVPLNVLGDLSKGINASARAVAPMVKAPIEARQQRIQIERARESEMNAPRIDAAKDAFEMKLSLNPALSNPGAVNRMRAAAVGSKALDSNLSKLNLPEVAARAREDMGLPETTKLNAKAFDTALNAPKISEPYNKIKEIPHITADATVLDDLDRLRVAPTIGDMGEANTINNFLDIAKQQLQAGADGKTIVDSIRQRRRDAQAIYNQQSAGVNPPSPEAIARADASMGIANALEKAVENSITDPRLLTEFQNARSLAARIYDYRRATNLATGVVDPQALAKLAAEGKPLSGNLAKLANAAANFPENLQGGVVREPSFREKLTRSSAGGTAGALIGSIGGLPGAIVGGGVGAALGNVGAGLAARRMATPGFQKSTAMPPDYRPIPSGLTPAEVRYGPNQIVPYQPEVVGSSMGGPANKLRIIGYDENGRPIYKAEETRQGFTTPQPSPEFGPTVFESQRGLPNEVPRQIYEAQKRAELAQGFKETAERKPAGQGTNLVFDAAGNLVPESPAVGQVNIIGAPTSLESAVRKMHGEMVFETRSQYKRVQTGTDAQGAPIYETRQVPLTLTPAEAKKYALPTRETQAFAMTAEEKIAWNKAKADLSKVVPSLRALDDKAIAAKMLDRAWVEQTVAKAREQADKLVRQEALLAEQLANRNNLRMLAGEIEAKQKQLAKIKSDRISLMESVEQMEEGLRNPRPDVSGKQQGPKTRAAKRNALAPDNQNNLAP